MAAFTLITAACGASVPPAATPTGVTIILPVIATPQVTQTLAPTATPTVAPTPTAFVTAPPPGKVAVVPILMYHHLQDLPNDATELRQTWTVSPQNFQDQMDWIVRRGFHTITMSQLVEHLRNGKPLPDKPVIVSFDDGWEEQYTVAFPILRKLSLIGTFFVYTRPIDHAQFMTWAQLQEMSAVGMDIQPHTLTHPHLRALLPDEGMKEIGESKNILEAHLGKPMIALAYPFGEYNAAVVEMLKRAGYQAAVTLNPGYRQRSDELFALHRIRVSYRDSLDDFSSRMPY